MFDKIKFKGTWRPYQKRVLDNLSRHLDDNKLHLVAAPGAGKTTLGLEVISRIAKPTLIFAPTLTIKAQWRRRLLLDFTSNPEEIDSYISMDINEPKLLTITTYQGLLAAFKGQKEEAVPAIQEEILEENQEEKQEDSSETSEEVFEEQDKKIDRFSLEKAAQIIEKLKAQQVSVLCFDEAHHLRKEWWKALDYLIKNLAPKHTLSLTGTPPYDVDQIEWKRYEDLCGPIDDLISISELVKNGTLCPHQDLLYFSKLRDYEDETLKEYSEKINKFVEMFLNHPTLVQKLAQLPQFNAEKLDLEFLFDKPSFCLALLAFLKYKEYPISGKILKAFEIKEEDLPPFDKKAAEFLLNELFTGENLFPSCAEEITELKNKAIHLGLTYRRKLCLYNHPKIQKMLSSSVGKLDSIDEVVSVEYESLKEELRMVILADYIRKDTLNTNDICLGVIPIFKVLKEKKEPFKLAVLTGTLIFIPVQIKDKFLELLKQKNITEEEISFNTLAQDERYLSITPKEKVKSQIVQLITDLFSQGYINIIVGTQALLGEGWDAPCINSLILSSTVSSYMLSNQMRGRALRVVKDKPNKISHIWHLGTIKILNVVEQFKQILPSSFKEGDQNVSQRILSYDLDRITKRFEGFEAPSLNKPYTISNDIERVFPAIKFSALRKFEELKESYFINTTGFCLKYKRETTLHAWQQALLGRTNAPKLKRGIDTPATYASLNYNGGYWYRLIIASVIAIYLIRSFLLANFSVGVIAVLLGYIAFMFRPTLRIIKTGSVEKVLKQVALVFLKVMHRQKMIKILPSQVHIETCGVEEAVVFISFDNLSPEENKMLIAALKEFLDPIENPRYIIVRKTFDEKDLKQVDYHAIPSIFSRSKKCVELLREFWEDEIGPCNIIYTRTIRGRKFLLRARENAFSALNSKNKQISRWM